jgi:hypothetical protein
MEGVSVTIREPKQGVFVVEQVMEWENDGCKLDISVRLKTIDGESLESLRARAWKEASEKAGSLARALQTRADGKSAQR